MREQVIKDLLRLSLAVAARQDEFYFRELGPIHLIKHLYLADWAYSRTHQGETFTGIDWTFYHFGPFQRELDPFIRNYVPTLGVTERRFNAPNDAEGIRWSFPHRTKTDPEGSNVESLFLELENKLPKEVVSAIKEAVKEYGGATYPLLRYVYKTPPMLVSTPNQPIDFKKAYATYYAPPESEQSEFEDPPIFQIIHPQGVSKTQEKKYAAKRAEWRQQMKEACAKVDAGPTVELPVNYDEDFEEGTAWLDGLAGNPIGCVDAHLQIMPSVWESEIRGVPSVL